MEFYNKPDDGRQKRRQSSDFGEISNLQTDLDVSQEDWDRSFHKYDDPFNCSGRKRVTGCVICKRLDNGETVKGLNGKYYSLVEGKLVINDENSNNR